MAKRLSETERTWQRYHIALGEAIAAWADLESELAGWFCSVAGVNKFTGYAIFYSGRNFATRADMLKAAIEHPQCADEDLAIIKAGLAVALRYSGFRNAMAHDRHVQFFNGEIYFARGDGVPEAIRDGRAYTRAHIEQATANIRKLADLISGPDLWAGEDHRGWREPQLEQLLLLPTGAHQSEPRLKPKSKKPPPQRGRG